MSIAPSMLAADIYRTITVSAPPEHTAEDEKRVKPAHHAAKGFTNPWPSYRRPAFARFFTAMMWNHLKNQPKIPENLSDLIPVQAPNFGAGEDSEQVKATWLGHACYFVELPTPPGAKRGPRILFDPALSHRCFASDHFGPERITPVPCKTEEIPEVDVIVLSHNHYDHTDTKTLQQLTTAHKSHVFAPLGNGPYLESCGIPKSDIHILDWWDARTVDLQLPGSADKAVASSFKVTCTPCQHFSGRGMFDRFLTLWASWAVEEILPAGTARTEPKRVFFGGDTAYRTVFAGDDENTVPVCPAFAEIGKKLGPFDLAMLPIGAYSPRTIFSNIHANPSDSVGIFKDIRARKGLAMHWGTWVLTTEPIMEPPELLKRACDTAGIPEGDFTTCGLGETRLF